MSAVPFNPKWQGLRIKSTVLPPLPMARGRGGLRADAGGTQTNFATPEPAIVNDGMGNYHEALRTSKDRSQIPYAMVHLRPQILRLLNGLNRKMLAGVSRYLVDNGGVASYVVNQIADYSVPVFPRSQCDDPAGKAILNQAFSDWMDQCDFTRRYTFEEIQRIMCLAMDVDGDIGATMTDDTGLPQLRLWDTFHIGKLTGLDPKDGVQTNDNNGMLEGYNVCDGSVETITGAALKFIDANKFTLLYDVERYNNYRGFTPLRKGANDLRDTKDIRAFLKLKEKIGAALAAVIQQNGSIEEDVWGNDTGDRGNSPIGNDENSPATQADKKLALAELLGGEIPVIEGELKQFVTQAISEQSMHFMDVLDSQFVLGLGIPPAFFLDEKLTGPNVRSVLGKVQKKFNNRKKVFAKFVRWCWLRVIGWKIAKGEIPAFKGWQKISFQFTPQSTIDLGDSMANERADVLVGQMSETRRYANRGEDFEHEHDAIKSEIEIKLKDAIAIAQQGSGGDKQVFNMLLPAVLARFGLVGIPTTNLAIQDAATEQQKNNEKNSEGGGKEKPATTEKKD
ncbi:MAG: phage portal protein [Verrucomicrobiota bacterium]